MSSRLRLGVLLWICGTLLSGRADAPDPARNLYSPHPPVTNFVEGISWPEGQALPTFATPAPVLDSIEVQALTRDEQITFSALQGQVNRKQPRIYLLDARAGEGRDTWANTGSAGVELAADGTPNTLWTASEKGAQWLEFHFGDVYEISRYVIRHAGASGLSRDLNTRDFMVQVCADGEAWTNIDEIKGNTSDVTDVDLQPVKARSVKIILSDPGADSTARISDIEIFGRKAR